MASRGLGWEGLVAFADVREESRDRMALLVEAGMMLASELSLDSVLQRMVELAAKVTGARYAGLGVLGPGEGIREFVTVGVTAEQRQHIGELPVGRGVLGLLITEARTIRIPDIGRDPASVGFPPNHPEMHSFLGAPVKAGGRVFGNIYLTEKQGASEFTLEDERSIEVLAAQAGVAIENATARRELERLALMDDRERIAKELHDGVIQSLFAVGMGLQATVTLSRDEAIEQRIEDAVAEIDRVIRDLRNYIFGLRPGLLADRQLDQALRQLAEDFHDRTDVVAVTDIDTAVAAELGTRSSDVLQLVREALSNVGRHAQAATCRLSLYLRDGQAVLEIDDDGRGFDPSTVRGSSQGLRNLQERAESLGGKLDVHTVLGEGTTLRVTLPL
jgi:signal transduction histidine kinase